MPAIDFSGETYTTSDGAFTIDLGLIPKETWVRAFGKGVYHAMHNEAIAKAAPTAQKDGVGLDGEARENVIRNAREKILTNMLDKVWAVEGQARAPRGPSADRYTQLFNKEWADAARQHASRLTKVKDAKDSWLLPVNGEMKIATLKDLMELYFSNPDVGAERRAKVEQAAKEALELENKKAARKVEIRAEAATAANGAVF